MLRIMIMIETTERDCDASQDITAGGRGPTEETDLSVEEIVKLAVAAGRMAAEREPKDAYEATERRLYALPVLREKQAHDRELVLQAGAAGEIALKSVMAADAEEIKTLETALSIIAEDEYYSAVTGRYIDGLTDEEIGTILRRDMTTLWRNRKRLVQRLAVWLYGAAASK
jgi:DNA-directed RNA polymerase specialized sigma24 family protein